MKLFSTGLIVLALVACDKDHKKKDSPNTPSNPAPAGPTEVKPTPAPQPTQGYLGSWLACKEFEQGDAIEGLNFPIVTERRVLQFKADGSLAQTITLHTDKSCTKQVSEADLKAYIKRLKDLTGIDMERPEEFVALAQPIVFETIYEIAADLGQGQFQLNTLVTGSERSYTTMKVSGETLILAYACDQDDVDSGVCEKITGESPENRATIDARALNLTKLK